MSEDEELERKDIGEEHSDLDRAKEPEGELGGELGGEPEEKRVKSRRKGLSSRRNKVLIVVVIIVIALIIGLWGAAPGDYISVKDVVKNSAKYIGEEVEVKGKVGNWTGNQNFTIIDDNNASIAIKVVHDGALPEGFASKKDVVVKGKLEDTENGLTIKSTKIQVGCPSKY
jgi:cytochrome c-type biogenesis protein CcmE